MNPEIARSQMISQQLRTWKISHPEVLDVMASVPREEFVPAEFRGLAFADTNIPIGHGEVMLAPKLQGRLLQAVDPKPDDKVLEIGTGLGFLTACLSRLAGSVHSLDIQPEFVQEARSHLGRLEVDNATIENGDALAFDLSKKYDVIVITGSLPQYDDRFERALRPGGRLVLVVGASPVMEARLVIKAGEHCAHDVLFETDIPMLTNARQPESFVF
ncbi:MAG: protein-L-isoaspartate O-methyltransferase family protein [Gammaproteobacteria bacterium]